jgi:unsaturated rhamnogalacturonyl hydrolase
MFVFIIGCGGSERLAEAPAVVPQPRPATSNAAPAPATAATPVAIAATPVPVLEGIEIEVKNPLGVARTAETISVRLSEVQKLLPSLQISKVVVQDASGSAVLSQLVDTDGDERPDELVFQTALGPNESKRFALGEGVRSTPKRDQFKVYGRFVRERHDDFAWENDHIAHRMYGTGLETWAQEPLTSSGVDIWVKRTPRLVVNDWYQADDYHRDNGDGGDFYSVGPSRGCGGVGIWDGKELHVSRNFVASRVLANGPIRLIFELDYAPWDAGGGVKISETMRVITDAGQHFDRFQSSFKITGKPAGLTLGIGIAKHSGGVFEDDKQAGVLRSWEPYAGDNGHVGCAVLSVSPSAAGRAETKSDRLLLTALPTAAPVTYLAGTGWDKGGDVPDSAAWAARVSTAESELQKPVLLSLTVKSTGAPHGAALRWSERAAHALIEQNPNGLTDKWEYDSGLVLKGMLALGLKTKDPRYFAYVKLTVDRLLDETGKIKGYHAQEHNLDAINMGKVLFPLLANSTDEKDRARYQHALSSLREQLKQQPRTRDGGFWHKQIYPHQMWLDGIYMASPFLAQYGLTFAEPSALDDAAEQALLAEEHLSDPKTGLLYHGWDESRAERWANHKTGTSSQFWGRSVGWYAMALVDLLELLPEHHPKRAPLLAVFQRLSRAIVSVQDKPTGVWWQVLDAPGREKNYREASASSMFVYALAKAARLGIIGRAQFEPAIERGSRGLLEQFASFDAHEQLHLKNICKVAGLGGDPYRDGSYAYYTSTEISDTDPKGLGAFLLATAETD